MSFGPNSACGKDYKKVNALCLSVVVVVVVDLIAVVCLLSGDLLDEQQRIDEHEDAGDDCDRAESQSCIPGESISPVLVGFN